MLRIARRGEIAPDSFKAWLVVQVVDGTYSLRPLFAFGFIMSFQALVVGYAWFAHARLAWGPLAGLCLVLPTVLFLMWRYRRARRLNLPLAEA